MPTSLVSTGIEFPDATTQTTAAVTGGGYALQNYVAPATWTKPAGLKAVKVTVVGAGGNGGSIPVTPSPIISASGGGGGGATIEFIPAPSIPGPVAVTAGPGTNSFGGFCSATAGTNGAGNPTPATVTLGGAGGAGSGGNINFSGSRGGYSGRITGSPVQYLGGEGGNSLLGSGGAGVLSPNTGVVGIAGTAYGGGGAGAAGQISASVPVVGGAGAPGIVIVEEFY
jgi:hypothetical protein